MQVDEAGKGEGREGRGGGRGRGRGGRGRGRGRGRGGGGPKTCYHCGKVSHSYQYDVPPSNSYFDVDYDNSIMNCYKRQELNEDDKCNVCDCWKSNRSVK